MMSKEGKREKTEEVILLFGKNGQLGGELLKTLTPLGKIISPGRSEIDLLEQAKLREIISAVKPSLVINAAAYTAVDQAETEREQAMAINGVAPGVMAEECKKIGALLIHYSTDYIFDGAKGSAYNEEDKPNPLNYYGLTKLTGEEAIRLSGGAHLILRLGWVYGSRGSNFLLTMLKLAREREELRIVNDQVGTPNWSYMLAESTAAICSQIKGRLSAEGSAFKSGVYHLSALGETTWYKFAKSIFEHSADVDRLLRALIPIKSEEYKTAAIRPAYTVLNSGKLEQDYSIITEHWENYLIRVINSMGLGSGQTQ